MHKKMNWSLLGSVLSANLASIIAGAAYSWTSPVLPKLNAVENIDDNPFGRPITPFEESWITSLVSVGAAIGPLLSIPVMDRIGRKKTLLIVAVPMIVSHLILAFTTDINLYYFSRLFLGLGVGCIYSVIPTYVGEIAENTNRGAFGCVMGLMCTAATLLCYTIGPFLTIKAFCLVLVIPPVAFFMLFGLFAPESPYFLLMMGEENEAKLALRKIRNHFVDKELEEMKKNVEKSRLVHVSIRDSLNSKVIRRGLLIGCGLMFFQQSSGITVMISYMQPIFDAAGSTLQPELSAIIVGAIQLTTNFLTSQLVDRLGRRILLLCSLTGICLSHILLGTYFYLKTNNFDDAVSYLFWLPVSSMILYVIMCSIGIGPIAWSMIGELFPPHFRNYASGFVSSFCLSLAFLLALFFPNIREIIGMAASFWIFALLSALGIIFVWLVVPETKAKSLHHIQLILESGSKV
ncbi:facilitated trehalose transporter Tret1-like [Tenebrio molitor]|uniref:facilitated trehalose transporter Tret1-like n=1 Tax=Tenebrio molitor TaxID=7067 RepID=UPI0036247112